MNMNLSMAIVWMRAKAKEFIDDERGINTIEVVIILAVVVTLGILFQRQITKLFQDLWEQAVNGTEVIGNGRS